jgi:hypothetical protein
MTSLLKVSKVVQRHPFHLVDPSPWPFVASISAFCCATGLVMYMHAYKGSGFVLTTGFFTLITTMFV